MRFLAVQEVLQLHQMQINKHGGSPGLRDAGLLDAAVHAPQATFGGEYLYPEVFTMAAVYLLHLAGNHPFVDGNKRTAWHACRVFLLMNGWRIKPRWKETAHFVQAVASGEVRAAQDIATWLAARAEEI